LDSFFVAKQVQLEEKINEWSARFPDRLRVDWVESYSGHKVYALSVSDFGQDASLKKAHFFAQPHAHEPGTTAGMVNVIEELLTGKNMLGQDTALDVQEVLGRTLLTFNPIGNPQGRENAPVLCWDGSSYSNDQFWCWMRGEDPDQPGKMWKRLDLWDRRHERAPDPVGIVYEQIDVYRYVEPNRSHASSYFKLFHMLDQRYQYRAWLDLHQTEFVNSSFNCMMLEALEGETTGEIKRYNRVWGEAIVQAWGDAGYRSYPEPKALSYSGVQAAYFRQNWGRLHQRIRILNTEVKNNAADAPPQFQMEAQSIAMLKSIEMLLNNAID
jgi:hypothetical protein